MSVDGFLVGAWASTEAFGNTALDWSEDVKAGKAELHLAFSADGRVTFRIEKSAKSYRHVLPPESSFTCDVATSTLQMHQDISGLEWHYQKEDDVNLRLRLVGAKRFGRCNGVDVIYLRRVV
ncbi:hypothetical protein SDRG_00943 [Saprolegnia diclina VS20]|uniref:Uncharacterized protein n=1 Tax=Saprolegnia diclina (strain VS20) TaxID=1156394 RepID=T0SGP4_SAPDV|nr:hypothetical protein SDRG_00943 [Saprolegnia diclina VS20]EQC42102.1 hypothetical protein SDRG_00943 [Saprolegnia diclina VS20]|eukprot:XP_008604671.1 hypothetical protein SDRG_00943 [Saprolegnia diclina VS20]